MRNGGLGQSLRATRARRAKARFARGPGSAEIDVSDGDRIRPIRLKTTAATGVERRPKDRILC